MSRLAVVTGGSSGIGLEVGRQLVARGYDVVLTARREGPLTEAAVATGARSLRAGRREGPRPHRAVTR